MIGEKLCILIIVGWGITTFLLGYASARKP